MTQQHAAEPIYRSSAPKQSVAKSYAVYADRIELSLNLVDESLVIPLGDIVNVTLVPGGLSEIILGTLKRRYPLLSLLWCMVLDLGITRPHILLKSRSGPIRYYRFTPEDPVAFIAACHEILIRDDSRTNRSVN